MRDAVPIGRRVLVAAGPLAGSIPAAQGAPRTVPNASAAQARTEFLAVAGRRLAHRSLGEGEPLVFLHRFRASMDDWDPALLDAVVRGGRRVVLFDAPGVGESEGEVPTGLEAAADDAAAFVRALGLDRADVLGWSMGGMTAQLMALRHPGLVRRLVLTGTLPPGGDPAIVVSSPEWSAVAGKPAYTRADILRLFFTESAASIAAGNASLDRLSRPGSPGERIKTTPEAMRAQLQAIVGFYRGEGGWYGRLREIRQPTLVANGDADGAFPPIDSVILAREIPDAQLVLYPDSGHGFLFQYPERFAADLLNFLHHTR